MSRWWKLQSIVMPMRGGWSLTQRGLFESLRGLRSSSPLLSSGSSPPIIRHDDVRGAPRHAHDRRAGAGSGVAPHTAVRHARRGLPADRRGKVGVELRHRLAEHVGEVVEVRQLLRGERLERHLVPGPLINATVNNIKLREQMPTSDKKGRPPAPFARGLPAPPRADLFRD